MGERRAVERRRGGRHLAKIEQHRVGRRDDKEGMLADDGIVALEDILIVRVPPVALLVGIVLAERVPLVIAIPRRKADAPAVFHGHEMAALLAVAGQYAGWAGVAERRVAWQPPQPFWGRRQRPFRRRP